MFTRPALTVAVLACLAAAPAYAQDLAFGPHLLRRDGGTHAGGAIAGSAPVGSVAAIVELGGTRRGGHNDWRVTAGPRLSLTGGDRIRVLVHGLIGAAIRNSRAALGWTAGVGVDMRGAGRLGFRVQLDAVGERRDAVSHTGGRLSAWLVLR